MFYIFIQHIYCILLVCIYVLLIYIYIYVYTYNQNRVISISISSLANFVCQESQTILVILIYIYIVWIYCDLIVQEGPEAPYPQSTALDSISLFPLPHLPALESVVLLYSILLQ